MRSAPHAVSVHLFVAFDKSKSKEMHAAICVLFASSFAAISSQKQPDARSWLGRTMTLAVSALLLAELDMNSHRPMLCGNYVYLAQ